MMETRFLDIIKSECSKFGRTHHVVFQRLKETGQTDSDVTQSLSSQELHEKVRAQIHNLDSQKSKK